MARRQSLPPRPDPSADRLLRFSDGITVDPILCPRRIHARTHWINGHVCMCSQQEALRGSEESTANPVRP